MRLWICAAAVNGFVAVAVASFAAHGLGHEATPDVVRWLDTGARYQLIHALALLGVALLSGGPGGSARALTVAGWGFLLGTVLFSGGLYLMALSRWRGLGAVVPVGGIGFLVGWAGLLGHGLGLSRGAPSA